MIDFDKFAHPPIKLKHEFSSPTAFFGLLLVTCFLLLIYIGPFDGFSKFFAQREKEKVSLAETLPELTVSINAEGKGNDGISVAGTIEISVQSAADFSASQIKLLIDNQQVSEVNASTLDYSWNSRSVDNGIHQIHAQATDGSKTVDSTQTSILVNHDIDNDGYGITVEENIGTDPFDSCGDNAWPTDINDDKAVSASDISQVVKHFGKNRSEADWSRIKRYDLNADGSISATDIYNIVGHFGETCTDIVLEALSCSQLKINWYDPTAGPVQVRVANDPASLSTSPIYQKEFLKSGSETASVFEISGLAGSTTFYANLYKQDENDSWQPLSGSAYSVTTPDCDLNFSDNQVVICNRIGISWEPEATSDDRIIFEKVISPSSDLDIQKISDLSLETILDQNISGQSDFLWQDAELDTIYFVHLQNQNTWRSQPAVIKTDSSCNVDFSLLSQKNQSSTGQTGFTLIPNAYAGHLRFAAQNSGVHMGATPTRTCGDRNGGPALAILWNRDQARDRTVSRSVIVAVHPVGGDFGSARAPLFWKQVPAGWGMYGIEFSNFLPSNRDYNVALIDPLSVIRFDARGRISHFDWGSPLILSQRQDGVTYFGQWSRNNGCSFNFGAVVPQNCNSASALWSGSRRHGAIALNWLAYGVRWAPFKLYNVSGQQGFTTNDLTPRNIYSLHFLDNARFITDRKVFATPARCHAPSPIPASTLGIGNKRCTSSAWRGDFYWGSSIGASKYSLIASAWFYNRFGNGRFIWKIVDDNASNPVSTRLHMGVTLRHYWGVWAIAPGAGNSVFTGYPRDFSFPPVNCNIDWSGSKYDLIEYIDQIAGNDLLNDGNGNRLREVMVGVAGVESTYSQGEVSPDGVYHGLFQYLVSTWNSAVEQCPNTGSDIYDGYAQIRVTACYARLNGKVAWPTYSNGAWLNRVDDYFN